MFDYNNMIKRAVQFFPTWSDIRKRYNKSNGGNLLQSFLDESIDIEQAIKEYKNYYFLDQYKGCEDSIPAFTYRTNIGLLETEDFNSLKITYNDKPLLVTQSLDIFYNNNNHCYYENGYIHIKEQDYTNSSMQVLLDDYSSDYILTKHHVWNIFDEFACFVNLKRHENETNKELVNRIIYITKNPVNSTEDGIKNSIIAELTNIIPIDKNDIEIVNANDNKDVYNEAYKDFNTLLDYISTINRDSLRFKQWDLDKWEYDFKSIDYLAHKWDESITDFKNGIGYGTDLEVVTSDNNYKTDAKITLYDKDEETLLKYVHNKHINKKLNFKLQRYNNVLTPLSAKYKIQASEAIDITHEDIKLMAFEDSYKSEKRYVQDVYKFGSGIVPIDSSKLTDTNNYRLDFVPGNSSYNMQINKCKVKYKNRKTGELIKTLDLLKQSPGFILNSEGMLVNNTLKKAIKSVHNLNNYENLKDDYVNNGITILDNHNSGKAVLSVSGLGMNFIKIDAVHQLTNIPKDAIKLDQYCFWNNNQINFRTDVNGTKKIEVNLEANIVEFKMLDDNSITVFLQDIEKGTSEEIKPNKQGIFNTGYTDKPRQLKVVINNYSNKNCRLSDFKYSNHEINCSLQYGDLLKTNDNQLMLPNFNVNSLTVSLVSKSGLSPIIKGIYIGSDLNKLTYRTDIIPHITDCDRILEITSNCNTNLNIVNMHGTIQSTVNNYEPVISYKAIKEDAWIRLKTNDYADVKRITTDVGKIEVVEESGILYYDLKLKTGDMARAINITGNRLSPAREITLTEMIKMYVPSYDVSKDKLFCSKISKGLILEKSDIENPYTAIIQIKSNILSGINAIKYKIVAPDYIGSVFGSSNNIEDISRETSKSFDYISFYPAENNIYNAINQTNLFSNELRGIKITNNFAPLLNMNTMMFYKAESSDINYKIKFSTAYDNNKEFDTLNDWTLGLKDIAIKTTQDLNNESVYDVSTYEIEQDIVLNNYIDLKDSYLLANNENVFTNKCIVIPPKNTTVIYDRYDGTTEKEKHVKYEEFIIESDGFNKLQYSNIDEILYIGFVPYSGVNQEMTSAYSILKDEGIIIWTDKDLIDNSQKVYVRYSIKQPIALSIDIDELYNQIEYMVDAYKEINSFNIYQINDGEKYDLNQIEEFEKTDLVHVSCYNSSFNAYISNNFIKFSKDIKEDTIMVKTGYYYINGQEYYLFSDKDGMSIDKNRVVEYINVESSGGELTLVKSTNNYIRNSEMLFKGMNELYKFDKSKDLTYGISNFNQLTACDSFNGWTVFGTKIYLKDGLNGAALSFDPYLDNGYAFIDISDYINKDSNIISMWAEKDLEIYLGQEKSYMGIDFNRHFNIEIKEEIKHIDNKLIRYSGIEYDKNIKQYLIIKGKGSLDDVIINNDSNINIYDCHKKNIDKLGFKIEEHIISGTRIRLSIPNNKYCISDGSSLNSNGYITMDSNMDWGATLIKSYDRYEDFYNCEVTNADINTEYIQSTNTNASIITEPINLDNPLTVKRLFVKINNLAFNNMKGFKTTILTSNNKDGEYSACTVFKDNFNFIYGDQLLKYIKIKIELPSNKVIDNISIFAEHKSDENNMPKAYTQNKGSLITKITDLSETCNIKLRDINIESNSLTDFNIYIRGAKDKYSADIWLPWKLISLKDVNDKIVLDKNLILEDIRFIQVKVELKSKNASVKLKHLDIEVTN